MLSVQLPPFLQKKSESGKGTVFFSLFLFCLFVFISYFEKGCRKKCTRQSRKVLWVVLSSLLFQKNLKEWQERPWTYVYECLWKATKVGSTATVVRKSVLIISHITFRDCPVHVFPTTFLEIAAYLSHKYCRTGEGN